MKKQVSKAAFIKSVEQEVRAIRKHANKAQIGRLDFIRLRPSSTRKCIYGQMTTNCKNNKAIKLISKCCNRIVLNRAYKCHRPTYSDIKWGVNGANKGQIEERDYSIEYFSALEAYILLKGAKSSQIISYLKGETNKLKL